MGFCCCFQQALLQTLTTTRGDDTAHKPASGCSRPDLLSVVDLLQKTKPLKQMSRTQYQRAARSSLTSLQLECQLQLIQSTFALRPLSTGCPGVTLRTLLALLLALSLILKVLYLTCAPSAFQACDFTPADI